MRIGAAETERADPGATRLTLGAAAPLARVVEHVERRLIDRYARVEPRVPVQPRQRAVLEREQHLDHTGDPCRRFEMPDVGLDRTESAVSRRQRQSLALCERAERPK